MPPTNAAIAVPPAGGDEVDEGLGDALSKEASLQYFILCLRTC